MPTVLLYDLCATTRWQCDNVVVAVTTTVSDDDVLQGFRGC